MNSDLEWTCSQCGASMLQDLEHCLKCNTPRWKTWANLPHTEGILKSMGDGERESRAAGNTPKFEIMEDMGKCPLCNEDWGGCAPRCKAPHPWGGPQGAKPRGPTLLTRVELLDRLVDLIEIGASSSTNAVNCLSGLLHSEAIRCHPDEPWVAKLRDVESRHRETSREADIP